MIPGHVLEKNTRNLYTFFPSFFNRKYVHTVKGVTGSVPLCPIMALGSIAAWISVEHKMRRSYKDDRTSGRVDVFSVERGRQNTYKGFEYFSQGHDQESWGKHLFLL